MLVVVRLFSSLSLLWVCGSCYVVVAVVADGLFLVVRQSPDF